MNNFNSDDDYAYDEKQTTAKKKKNPIKSDISFSSVLSTSSCSAEFQKSRSIRTIYPPPTSNCSMNHHLPSSYESTFADRSNGMRTNEIDSKECVLREFSKILLAFDKNGHTKNSITDNLSNSKSTVEGKMQEPQIQKEDRSKSSENSNKILPENSANIVEEKPKKAKRKKQIISDEVSNIEHLQSIEDCIRLPITTTELNRLCLSENLIISYNEDFEAEIDSENVEFKEPIKVGEHIVNYPKIRNLMPTKSKVVGAYCIKTATYDNVNIITCCSSQQSLNGSAGKSKIMSTIDRNFKLIEEKKTECQIFPDKLDERIIHVVKENDRFIVFRTEFNEKRIGTQYRGEITLPSGDMLLDGGSYVLLRYLVLKKFSGKLKFWSMDINGTMCKCIYDIGKICVLHINNIPYKTYRVKKTLQKPGRKNDISKSYYLSSGFLVRHEWKNCPYFLHINPLSKIPPKTYPNLEQDWMNDVILISKYLDEKDKRVSEITTYIDDHPQISNMMKDYLLCLLYNQPENTLEYTIDYFLNIFNVK